MIKDQIKTRTIADGDAPNPEGPPGVIDLVRVERASPASVERLLNEHPNIWITVAPDRTKRTWHSPRMTDGKLVWHVQERPVRTGPPAPEDLAEYVQVKCAPLPSCSRAHNGRMNQCASCGSDLRNFKAPLCIPCLAEALGTPLPPLALRHFQKGAIVFRPRYLASLGHFCPEPINRLEEGFGTIRIKVREQVQQQIQTERRQYDRINAPDCDGRRKACACKSARSAARLLHQIRNELFDKSRNRCFYCDDPLDHESDWDIDTVVPCRLSHAGNMSRGARANYYRAMDRLGNAVVCCAVCNYIKGLAEYRAFWLLDHIMEGRQKVAFDPFPVVTGEGLSHAARYRLEGSTTEKSGPLTDEEFADCARVLSLLCLRCAVPQRAEHQPWIMSYDTDSRTLFMDTELHGRRQILQVVPPLHLPERVAIRQRQRQKWQRKTY